MTTSTPLLKSTLETMLYLRHSKDIKNTKTQNLTLIKHIMQTIVMIITRIKENLGTIDNTLPFATVAFRSRFPSTVDIISEETTKVYLFRCAKHIFILYMARKKDRRLRP